MKTYSFDEVMRLLSVGDISSAFDMIWREGERSERERILELTPEIVRVAFAFAEDGIAGAAQDEIEWLIRGKKDE